MSAAAQADLFGGVAPNDRSGQSDMAHACRCEICRPKDPARTYTETFRHECEVRYIVSMTSNEQRAAYLEGVFEKRGRKAYRRLRKDAWNVIQVIQP